MRYIRQFAVFLVLLIACGFLLYSVYTDIESKTITQVNNEQMVHAGQAAAGIEHFFLAYNDSLSFLAENEHIITLDSDGRDLMRDFFTSHDREISSITRVDENGIIAYTYPVETSSGTDISPQSHIRDVMSTHAVVISDVFTSVQGFRTIAFHMPVFQDGRFRGSIAVLIPFDTLAKKTLGSITIIDSGYAWTISRNGVVLYSPYPGQVGESVFDVFNSSPTVTAMAREAMKGARGITTYTVSGDTVRHMPVQKYQAIYLPVTIGNTYWSIIVSTPENEILGTIQGFRNTLIVIFSILIISLFFFTYYLARARGIVQEEAIRRKAEDALRESEEKYRTLVESSFDGIAIHRDGVLVYVNRTGARLLGSDDPGIFIGKNAIDLIAPAFRQQIAERIQQSPQKTQELIREQFIRLDGTLIDVDVTTTPTIWNGRPAAYVTFRDITAQVHAEDALRESEEHYRYLFECTPAPMLIYERSTLRILATNEAFHTYYGYSRNEALAMRLTDLYPEGEKEPITALAASLHGYARAGEWHHRKKDGTWMTIVAYSHDMNYRGRESRVAVITDITKLKETENTLRESEEFNRGLVENLPDIIAVYDRNGIVRFANRAGLQVLGTDVSEVIGQPILSFVADHQRKELEKKMRERLSGVPVPPYEVEIRTCNDEPRTALLQAVPIMYRNEPGVLVLMTDITERKQAEQRLLEAHRDLEKKVAERTRELSEANLHLQELDRLKSLFIASMSHELRTPLNSIIGFTGIMAKGLAGEINAEQKKQLGMVQDSARHLLALINDVIDISKIEADKIEAGISTFNLADVIREVGITFGPAAQDRGLVLTMEIPGPITVTSDERRIRQIIMNLVSNAIKFTDRGRIDVIAEKKGEIVEVSVRDTGIGIGKDDLELLFRPFARIAMPGRLTEGTGLGLYLSKKLARFLGGDITAESEPHAGSVFVFSFPLVYNKKEDL